MASIRCDIELPTIKLPGALTTDHKASIDGLPVCVLEGSTGEALDPKGVTAIHLGLQHHRFTEEQRQMVYRAREAGYVVHPAEFY